MMRTLVEALVLLFISLVLGAGTLVFSHGGNQAKARDAYLLALSDVDTASPLVCWVDARSSPAYVREHIPNAVLLNEDEWEQLLPRFLEVYSPDKKVVVYCASDSCDASRQVAKRLREELGLKNIFTLEGGWEAWKRRAPR